MKRVTGTKVARGLYNFLEGRSPTRTGWEVLNEHGGGKAVASKSVVWDVVLGSGLRDPVVWEGWSRLT